MRRIMGTALAAVAFAGALPAQQPPEQRRAAAPPPAAPAPHPRIGYAATPAPPEAPAPVQFIQPVFYYTPNGYIVSGAPYLVLSDGSVLANFGNGYERVIRPCASARDRAPADPYARDALGRIPEPPGIAALRPGARGQLSGNAPGRNMAACYRSDGRGRTEIISGGY